MKISNLNAGETILMASDYYIVEQITFVRGGRDRVFLTPREGGSGITIWSDSPLLKQISIPNIRT